MRVRTLLYLCRLGLKNLWHNRVYSAASIITMSACIFLFGIFYLAVANVDALVQKTERDVYVSVFFDEDVLPGRVDEVGKLIQDRPEVLRTVYMCRQRRPGADLRKIIMGTGKSWTVYLRMITPWQPAAATRCIYTGRIGRRISWIMCPGFPASGR